MPCIKLIGAVMVMTHVFLFVFINALNHIRYKASNQN